MNNRVIGRIISINHNNVTAELTQNLGSYITLYDGIRFVGEIGSYVAIDDLNRRIIAEIISVDEKNEMAAEKLNKADCFTNRFVCNVSRISSEGKTK